MALSSSYVAPFVYQPKTRYRVMIRAGSGYEPHPTLPPFEHMTLAELEAAKVAGPTRVYAERNDRNGSIEGGLFGTPQGASANPSDRNRGVGHPSDLDSQHLTGDGDGAAIRKDAGSTTAALGTPVPQLTRCLKCGVWEHDPPRPYDNPKGICYTHDTPDGYPEPNGEHEWTRACDYCGDVLPLNSDGTPKYPTCAGSAVGLCGWCAREAISL